MVLITEEWRVDLSQQPLREKSDNIPCTSSSRLTSSARTDVIKDTPPTRAPPSGKADDSAQRDYDIPLPSRKDTTDDYERDDDGDDEKDKKKKREWTSW